MHLLQSIFHDCVTKTTYIHKQQIINYTQARNLKINNNYYSSPTHEYKLPLFCYFSTREYVHSRKYLFYTSSNFNKRFNANLAVPQLTTMFLSNFNVNNLYHGTKAEL